MGEHAAIPEVQPAALPVQAARGRGIPSLTGIRGVAAGWVFLTHFQAVLAAYLKAPSIETNAFMYNGFRGVDLFFVLSGFILMHVHGSDFRRVTYAETRDFYILRFFRVYPLNTVVLLALLPIGLAMPGLVQWFRYDHGVPIPYHSHDFSPAGFVQSLFLAQTWTVLKLGEWNGPSWTLSAEVFGYALFPVLASLLIRQRSRAACLCLALASLATLVLLLEAFGHGRDNPTGSFGLIRMLFCFVAGMSLSRCRQLWPTTSSPGTLVTLGSIAVCAATLASPATCLLIVFGFAGLIFGLAFRQGPVNTLMESRLAMFMGRISFSFYLIHFIPLKVSLWLMQTYFAETSLSFRILYLVGLVAFCVALATVTHHFLEVPFQRLARRLLVRDHAPAGRVRTA